MKHWLRGYRVSRDHDRKSMIYLMGICIPVALIFTVVNAMSGFEKLAMVQFSVVFVLSIYWCFAKRGRLLAYLGEVLMLCCVAIFGALIWLGGIGDLGVFWSLGFPFIAFLVMGVWRGWIWTIGYAIFIVTSFMLHIKAVVLLPYDEEVLLFVPIMYLFFALLGCILQLRNEKHVMLLQGLNAQLDENHIALQSSVENLEQKICSRTSELQAVNTRLSEEVVVKERALQSMRNSEKKFEHAQRMESVGILVGGIAHDFNNMLSGIFANLYMAQSEAQSEHQKARLKKIGDLAEHAADMIKQLLTFARKDDAEMKLFDLSVFMREAFHLAKVSIPGSIICRSDIEAGKVLINGNATQIQQVVMNLMNNANDALAHVDHPEITVSVSTMMADQALCDRLAGAELRSYVVLCVKDNGAGMPKDVLDSIFDPFFTTKEVGKGTGLGLAMIYGAMQSHQGLIDVDSREGHGSSFKLYFPLLDDEQVNMPQANVSAVVRGNGETILLVDDNVDLCDCHSELLQNMGYKVLIAHNGIEACEMYRKYPIDLVLMDVVMPKLGGVAAAQRIIASDADARIIFASGYDKDNELTSELVSDWQHLLHKPLDVEVLARAIHERLQIKS